MLKNRFAKLDHRRKHLNLFGEIRQLMWRGGYQCGRKYRRKVVLCHLVYCLICCNAGEKD